MPPPRAHLFRGRRWARAGEAAAVARPRSSATAGVAAAGSLEDRPLKAQLRAAERSGARSSAIIGDRETEAGTVTVRRLGDGVRGGRARGDVVNWLVERDGE